MLDYEKLDVYKLMRSFSREVCRLGKLMTPGRADLKDQLFRANASMPLNLAAKNCSSALCQR